MNETNSHTSPTADQSAAHAFLAELRTRITTQPLPYQYGVEARALESLWEVFAQARDAMKKHPGCEKFAAAVTHMLNVDLRPVTAKWHKAHEEGRLNSRDGADEFRGELADVQKKLRDFAETMHDMAYGSKKLDELSPPAMSEAELNKCFEELPFGIPLGTRNLPGNIIADINKAEAKEVCKRRKEHHLNTGPDINAVGMGLSGGGIRSATFSLGVIQVLASRDLLKEVDFLSTVSGGGYTGSFLTARLGTGASAEHVAGPRGPDPAPIRYVRHHAKFLNPVNLKDGWAIVTATLAGMLLNWTVPLLVIVLAAIVAVIFKGNTPESLWQITLGISGVLTGLALIAYCWLLRGSRKCREVGGWILGLSAGVTVLVSVFWLADIGYVRFVKLTAMGRLTAGSLGVLSGLIAVGPAIIRFFPLLKKPLLRRIAMQVLLWAAGLIIPILALTVFYLCRYIGDLPDETTSSIWNLTSHGGLAILAISALVLAGVAVFLLNINFTAPHRLYRDRLAKTFIQKTDTDDSPVPLAKVNSEQRAPYHLINTTLNLPSSEDPALRDRKCAFFLFSKHWSGSATTGYHPTRDWKMNGQPVDLATAMAISGAAASSHMGLGSKPTLTALLTFLNVRLGFWIHRPGTKVWSEAPGFSCLLREMVGVGMSEKAAWLNLSDGGHIENMAVYELLRRRCKFIICVDGEADPEFTFGGLMTLVRHAQLDYGIRLDPNVNELAPDPKTGWSQTHALLCRIHYPEMRAHGEPTIGLLLYIKLSVTGNEPELIKRYRNLHLEFPHESTADQFFDEEQFEAYRQLGVHVAEGLFSRTLMNGNVNPSSISEWFRSLAENLLEPETM